MTLERSDSLYEHSHVYTDSLAYVQITYMHMHVYVHLYTHMPCLED